MKSSMGRAIQEIIVWEGLPHPLSPNLTLASGQPSLIVVSLFGVDKGKLVHPRGDRVMNIMAWFTNMLKDATTVTTKRAWRLMLDWAGFSLFERSALTTRRELSGKGFVFFPYLGIYGNISQDVINKNVLFKKHISIKSQKQTKVKFARYISIYT